MKVNCNHDEKPTDRESVKRMDQSLWRMIGNIASAPES